MLPVAGLGLGLAAADPAPVLEQGSGTPQFLTAADAEFLEDLEHRSFLFFWEQANPANGLIPDRAHADGTGGRTDVSIAGVGFGLTALCIGEQRGWITHDAAYQRAQTTLNTFTHTVPNVHGFYYHFLDLNTGQRTRRCELSSIDTALLMAGVLTVRTHFPHTSVDNQAGTLFNNVDWPWMLNGGPTFALAWKPESGFSRYRWEGFSEHPLLDLMAMGSSSHPVAATVWSAWRRAPVVTYAGRTFLQSPALFTHQYPWAWIDVRNLRDDYADYFHNSTLATLAQRQMCMDMAAHFPSYGPNAWGITASDGPTHYHAWGGPHPTPDIDGTLVPAATAGSLPFAPAECLAVLRNLRDSFGATVYRRYGFVDAFNPLTKWTDPDVLAIDQGISLLMAENARSSFVLTTFMKNPEIQAALQQAHFRPKTLADDALSASTALYPAPARRPGT